MVACLYRSAQEFRRLTQDICIQLVDIAEEVLYFLLRHVPSCSEHTGRVAIFFKFPEDPAVGCRLRRLVEEPRRTKVYDYESNHGNDDGYSAADLLGR